MGLTSMDLLAAKPLDLDNIRYALIRQEDTIIFKLIEVSDMGHVVSHITDSARDVSFP